MVLSERFEEALILAIRLHARQFRKGTNIPYVSHLLSVAGIALEYGADEDEAIAALLHDAIEDQGGATAREEIRRRFGEKVVEIVNGCTDAEVLPKPPWRERKESYIARLRNASPSVRLIEAADKLHNIMTILKDYRAIGDKVWSRFTGDKEGTLWYYRSLVPAFQEGCGMPIVEELNRFVTELEDLVAGRKELQ
jgi:GTP pyrophosphokinase